jgi:hypothetical protein
MNRTTLAVACSVSVLALAAPGLAQDTCAKVNQAKAQTYGFHPGTLTKAEREQKSSQMDAFWNLVQSYGKRGLACVRQLMANEPADTFFLFDGASLLAKFDKSGASDSAILDGIVRSNMQDVAPDGYISLCLQLSKRDVDIGRAADKYIHAENVTVYLPQHGAYKLDRVRGAILLYGSMKPELIDKHLIPELSSSEHDVREVAALVLSQNLTEESFRALAALGAMENFSEETRESARYVQTPHHVEVVKPSKYTRQEMLNKLAQLPKMDEDIDEAEDKALDNSIFATFTLEDLDALRNGRRRMIVGVSNESVEGYAEMSRILLNLINVLDAYRQYRSR